MIRALIADPDLSTRRALALWLTYRFGIQDVVQVPDGNGLAESLSLSVPDLILMDWSIPNRPGQEFYAKIQAKNPLLRWFILSVNPDVPQGADEVMMKFIQKGSDLSELEAAIKEVIQLE